MTGGKLFIQLMLIGAALVAPAWSAETTPQALRDLIVLGIENNIGLKIRKIDIPTAKEDITFEDAAFDPEVYTSLAVSGTSNPYVSAFSASDSDDQRLVNGQLGLRKRFSLGTAANLVLTTERATGNDIFNDLSPSYRTALVLDLTQPLLRDAGNQVNATPLRLAENRSYQARLNYLLQAQALARGIADLTYQLSGAEQVVALRRDAVKLAERTLQANRKRFAVGVIPVSEIQEAETALADRQLSLSLARQSRELLQAELSRQLNRELPPSSTSLVADGGRAVTPVSLPGLEQLYAQARQKRLDLQISAVDQESAVLQTDYSLNQLRPKLDLQVQAGLNGLSGEPRTSTTTSHYHGNWFDSTGSLLAADGYQWSVGLLFSLPLDNRQAKARLQQARLQEQRSRSRQHDLEAQLKTELSQQLISLNRAGEQLKIAQKFESLAERSLQQEQRRLEEGLSDTFRILSFQDKMIEAKIGRIEALMQYRRNLSQMEYVRGTILESHGIRVIIDPEGSDYETI